MVGGLHSTEVAFLFLSQQPRVRFPAFLKIFPWSFSMLQGFFDGTAYDRKVDRALKISIKPI